MMNEPDINLLNRQRDFQDPNFRPARKRGRLFLILGILLFLIAGCSALVIAERNNESIEYDPVTLEPKQPEGLFKKLSYLVFKKNIDLEGEKKDRINILLLGIGGMGHDGPYLTDTIIIASIQPSTHKVALISIPRDLGVNIEKKGIYKINSASAFGESEKAGWGGAYATQIISDTFDLPIPYYIRLDFTAFEEIIDEVGGVRIEVPRTFTDTQYPGPNNSYQTITFKAGPQTMDGRTALKYARSRHGNNGEGSDFARARRQQQILLAVKEKVLSFSTLTNPIRIKKIMDALEKNMTTNMQFDEILELVRIGKELDTSTIKNLVLDDSPNGLLVNASTPGGAFILSPKSGNFTEINTTIQNIFNSESSLLIPHGSTSQVATITDNTPESEVLAEEETPHPSIEIQNGTWSAGLAARIAARLKEGGWYAEEVGNVAPEEKPITRSAVYVLNPKVEAVATQIATELHISLEKTLPKTLPPLATTTNIVVVLGDDFVE